MDAIDEVRTLTTPAVSQVGCAPAGGSGYKHAKQQVEPGTIGMAMP
jgi:hypothetical protein